LSLPVGMAVPLDAAAASGDGRAGSLEAMMLLSWDERKWVLYP
jgi:hypothetical protein